MKRITVPFVALVLSAACLPSAARAGLITIEATDTGFYNSQGVGGPGDYNTGREPSVGGRVFNSFFVFNLSSIPVGEEVTAAEFRVQRYTYISPDPSETVSLFDVTTPTTTLRSGSNVVNSPTGLAIVTDLGSGVPYGDLTVNSVGNTTDIVTTNLNAAAIEAINAARATPDRFFNIGGTLSSTPVPASALQAVFVSSSSAGTQQLRLTTSAAAISTPEPSTYAMMFIGLGMLVVAQRKKKKATA